MNHHLRHLPSQRGVFGEAAEGGLVTRLSAAVSSAVGTPAFVVAAIVFIGLWIAANGLGWASFDPRPFILLNLAFSAEAFFTGSLVIIAAKATAKRDAIHAEASAKHVQEEFDKLNQILAAQQEMLDNARCRCGCK